jgi:hypothetical protein
MAADLRWDATAATALGGAVSAGRLMAHLGEFARRVKLSGSAEELESFRYLEAEMAAAGFRTTLLSHDAYISLPGRSEVRVGGETLRSITHSMSRPTPAAGLSAPLVYVGTGDAAAFAAHDVAGRIVLVDGIALEDVAVAATRAGAVGQIHISPTEQLYEMCISPVWGSPSQHTRGELPTTAICTITHDDGAALRARCLASNVQAFMATEVDTGWRKTPLLVAELSAAEAPDEPFVLFSGHHDTWHFGVMDNGSANAAMLEAARVLAGARASWRRGLRVCFWSGHSHGRYSGSAWYADTAFDELDRRCVAHVNIDSTGGAGASEMTKSAVIDELKGVAAEAIAAITGQVHAGNRHGRVADQSFWGVGLPSMFGSLSYQPRAPGDPLPRLGWWWHTPCDLIEHIDADNLVRDTAVVLRVLHRLLTSPVLPLDYSACADSLLAELAGLEATAGRSLDLEGLRDAATTLKRQAAAVLAADAPAPAINRALMRTSRALVPLNYTYGDRFRHDIALDHPPWPALQGLRELAAQPPGSPDLSFYEVHARQTRNRIAHALRVANEALGDVLSNASTETQS